MTQFTNKYMSFKDLQHPKDLLSEADRVTIAYAMYDAGFRPCWSHDICDTLIAGYGDSMWGFRYELVVDTECGTADACVVPWEDVKRMIAEGIIK